MVSEPVTPPPMSPSSTAVPWRIAAPLRQQVVQLLRDAIVDNEFTPGERLVERVLCERYQVSRTVIREALRQLESEGLVTVEPNRGPVITTLSSAEVEDLYEAREALESVIARLFAERATGEQRAALHTSFETLETAASDGDGHNIRVAKDAYYEVLSAGAGNATLTRLLDAVHTRTSRARGLSLGTTGRTPKMLAEMRAITDAAVAGDAASAAAASAAHVRAASEAAQLALGGLATTSSPGRG